MSFLILLPYALLHYLHVYYYYIQELYSTYNIHFYFLFFNKKSLVLANTVHTNNMILLQDKQGKTHLTKFYVPFKDSEKHNVKYKVGSSCFTF